MAESRKNMAILAQLRAKALVDAEFKKQLIADPAGVLKAAGLTFDPSIQVKVLESTATQRYLVLPYVEKGEITEEQLAMVAGGGSVQTQQDVVTHTTEATEAETTTHVAAETEVAVAVAVVLT